MRALIRRFILAGTAALAAAVPGADEQLPKVVITHDDTVITSSCVIEIPAVAILEDRNTNGVIHVAASNIKIRFAAGSLLRGAPESVPWNELTGIGIRIDGQSNVTIENARVRGFKNGIVATEAHGLVISDGDFSDNYRQRLKSTRSGESGEDWLFPHQNDRRKWRDQYGGAICVERSSNVTIRRVKVRRGQNGIILDRVENSAVYDNDCSFLSGWGLALWRSSRNNIHRNAFDFCIRGHFEDVYNRGQDSAGILCFEQSNENIFAENSATHGGDGFFGFAGHEAIGETWWNAERDRLRKATGRQDVEALIRPPPELVASLSQRGCNGNILIGNDFSYASAHGIELTFSEDNQILRNRIVENGICGLWGGYSTGTLIAENEISDNGGMAYGLERGGINMEHAADNLILKNRFVNNRCAIHLWWDDDGALMRFPGVAGMEKGVTGNVIARNDFVINQDADFKRLNDRSRVIVLQLRDSSKSRLADNYYLDNDVSIKNPIAQEFALQEGCDIIRTGKPPGYKIPKYSPLGETRPVGNRRDVRGRRWIVMDEWGPKEHGR